MTHDMMWDEQTLYLAEAWPVWPSGAHVYAVITDKNLLSRQNERGRQGGTTCTWCEV